MRAPCRPRPRVRDRVRVLVGPRDVGLMTALAHVGYADGGQLSHEFFGGKERYCRRRLSALTAAGLLEVTVLASNAARIFSLSRAGLATLRELDPDGTEGLRLPAPLRLGAAQHRLALADVRFYLGQLARTQQGMTLLSWENGLGSAAAGLELHRLRLVPDALVKLDVGGQPFRLAVELDAGTMGGRDMLPAKFGKYARALGQGLDELWVVDASARGRMDLLTRLVARAGIGESTRVVPLQHMTARPARPPLPRVGDATRAGAVGP